MSVPVEYTFHAAGRSQHGMSLRHAEALSMSDAITTAKLIIKQQAYESGLPRLLYAQAVGARTAVLVPVPVAIRPRRQQRLLGRGRREVPSLRRCQALYGRHPGACREISAITNPTVNSYKRITTGGDSVPQYATWGLRNRASMVRIPVYKPGKQLSTRIELRSPDPMPTRTCQRRHAGGCLDGIEQQLELPPGGNGRDAQAYRPSDGRGRLHAAAALAQRGARRV